jgi:hypothetical protein
VGAETIAMSSGAACRFARAALVALLALAATSAAGEADEPMLPPNVAPASVTREVAGRTPPGARDLDAGLASVTRVPYAPDALVPVEPAQRSVAIDRAAAEQLALMHGDAPTFTIYVEGDRDDRPRRPMSLEQRFSSDLGGSNHPVMDALSHNVLDTKPCPGLASMGNSIGGSYNPHPFCP